MKVLVVDDQRSMRIVCASIVQSLGHDVIEADCGQRALEICQNEKVDLILMDVEMPGMNGFETTKKIRELSPTWFPIIFVSAMTDTSFFAEGIRSGGDIYLFKPIVKEVLESMINAMHRIAKIQEELHSTKLRMELLAHQDALTGLVNRRGFDNAVALELEHSRADRSPLSLLLLDIDHFKAFNDHYGHPEGDACLTAVGKVLKSAACRPHDIASRYGGEEFAILLPNTKLEHAKIVADRVMDGMKQLAYSHEKSPTADHVTISAGIVELQSTETEDAFIKRADETLYKAKQAGRNQYLMA